MYWCSHVPVSPQAVVRRLALTTPAASMVVKRRFKRPSFTADARSFSARAIIGSPARPLTARLCRARLPAALAVGPPTRGRDALHSLLNTPRLPTAALHDLDSIFLLYHALKPRLASAQQRTAAYSTLAPCRCARTCSAQPFSSRHLPCTVLLARPLHASRRPLRAACRPLRSEYLATLGKMGASCPLRPARLSRGAARKRRTSSTQASQFFYREHLSVRGVCVEEPLTDGRFPPRCAGPARSPSTWVVQTAEALSSVDFALPSAGGVLEYRRANALTACLTLEPSFLVGD